MKLAKILIMFVRILGLAALILGGLLWFSGQPSYLKAHIGVGFSVVLVVFVLSLLALLKKAIVPGILGVVLAFLLPVVGFMQLPLRYRELGIIHVIHVMLALGILGVAERLYSAIQSAGA